MNSQTISVVFAPHRFCLLNDDMLIMSMNIGNAIIALAYYMIPFGLSYTINKLPIGFSPTGKYFFYGFAIFIFACGTTHLIDILVIYYPWYWLQAVGICFTAFVSLWMAVYTLWHLPKKVKEKKECSL